MDVQQREQLTAEGMDTLTRHPATTVATLPHFGTCIYQQCETPVGVHITLDRRPTLIAIGCKDCGLFSFYEPS